jgi:hypothetical protein
LSRAVRIAASQTCQSGLFSGALEQSAFGRVVSLEIRLCSSLVEAHIRGGKAKSKKELNERRR